jgi:hypothetical protein
MQALQGQPKGYLEARHAVFVADIQRMPRLIAKMFAVPAMRDYSYRVMLDREGRVAPRIPALWIACCGCNSRTASWWRNTSTPRLHNCVRRWRRLAHDRRRAAVISEPDSRLADLCAGVALGDLACAVGRAVHDSRRQHLLFGTVFALFMLWLVRRDFDTGVSYHFIGMTAVTLLLDWPLAIIGGLVAQLGLVSLGRQDLLAVGVNGALLILLPVLVTECCAIMVERAQPRNPFVYIFVPDFLPRHCRRCCACCWRCGCCGSTSVLPCRNGWRISSVTCGC